MSNFTVTLKQLRESGACFDGYNKLVASISGEPLVTANRYATYDQDAPIEIIQILDSNGLDDALWSLRCVSGEDKAIRLFAVFCARQVQHLIKDNRSVEALDIAEAFANGSASADELMAAQDAAWAAALDSASAASRASSRAAACAMACAAVNAASWDAAQVATWDEALTAAQSEAYAESHSEAHAAALAAAQDAAWAAARDAVQDAAHAAACAAAQFATWDAAYAAARKAQENQFRKILNGELA